MTDDTPRDPLATPTGKELRAAIRVQKDYMSHGPGVGFKDHHEAGEVIERAAKALDATRPSGGYEDKVRSDFDQAVEDVHRAFCEPDHELVGPWDRDMADALRRNGYTLSRATRPSGDEALTEERIEAAIQSAYDHHDDHRKRHPGHTGECQDDWPAAHRLAPLVRAALATPSSTPDVEGLRTCDVCGNVIRNEARGGIPPSAGDHDPAPHVAKAYGDSR